MKISLKTKIITLLLALSAIPFAGYYQVQELESILYKSSDSDLVEHAGRVARVLSQWPEAFLVNRQYRYDEMLYVSTLKNKLFIDGHADEWHEHQLNTTTYHSIALDRETVQLQLGRFKQVLYVLMRVSDSNIVFDHMDEHHNHIRGDYIRLLLTDKKQDLHEYLFSSTSPGALVAEEILDKKTHAGQFETRIRGGWQIVPGGYTVELAIPLNLIGERLGLEIVDIRNTANMISAIVTKISQSGLTSKLNIIPDEMNGVFRLLDAEANEKLVVSDNQGRVLLQKGWSSIAEINNEQAVLIDFLKQQPQKPKLITSDELSTIYYPIYAGSDLLGVLFLQKRLNHLSELKQQGYNMVNGVVIAVYCLVFMTAVYFLLKTSKQLQLLRERIDGHAKRLNFVTLPNNNDETKGILAIFYALLNKLRQYQLFWNGPMISLVQSASRLQQRTSSLINKVLDNDPKLDDTAALYQLELVQVRQQKLFEYINGLLQIEKYIQTADKKAVSLQEIILAQLSAAEAKHDHISFDCQMSEERSLMVAVKPLIEKLVELAIELAVQLSARETIEIHVIPRPRFVRIQLLKLVDKKGILAKAPAHAIGDDELDSVKMNMVEIITRYHGGRLVMQTNEFSEVCLTLILPTTPAP